MDFIICGDQTILPFYSVPMPRDGACLFHSISYFMYGSVFEQHSRIVREIIVNHVVANWNRLQVWSHDNEGDNYTSAEHYKNDMLRPTTYGSACEIIAASELFGYRFRVYQNGKILYTLGEEGHPVKHLRFSGVNLSSGHFDVYEPVPISSTDRKLFTKPAVVLKQCTMLIPQVSNSPVTRKNSDNYTGLETNRGNEELQPKAKRVKRRGSFSNAHRQKQLREAATKYRKSHPEIHRATVAKYTQENLDVHRTAVSKYTKKNPEVHRASVAKYTQEKPEVNRAAVAKYTREKPEVNRAAVAKYTREKPDVNRAAVARYMQENPEINKTAVAKYDPTHSKRLQRKKNVWLEKTNTGFEYDPAVTYDTDKTVVIGNMDIICDYCKALKWKGESKGLCCSNGKVNLNPLNKCPEPLCSLITGDHPESKHFLNNIRKYNSAFQMTSFGATQIIEGNHMPTFKVQGQVYHLIGSLLPPSGDHHKFLQLYFIGDDDEQTNARCANFSGIKPMLVNELQKMLHRCNKYVIDFKSALDCLPKDNDEFQVVIHADKKPIDKHKGRYNAPTTQEVGVVIVGQEFEKRDIVLKGRDGKLQRISETHRAYDALQYPLLFCYGEDGYSIAIPQINPSTKQHTRKTVSASSFYTYRLMIRNEDNNYLFYCRGLLNQFLVDTYAKIETERLNFIRNNQKKLRADSYIHLKDAVSRNDSNLKELGQAIILPSTFTGGARYMHEKTQDAMTYVRHYGRPDLFITFTCNPKWPDITNALFPGQNSQDRHDIICRTFHLKVKTMINLLTKANIFGTSRCFMYTIEWQKRGLPHVHILLWLKDKIKPSQIDQVICAEIPNPNDDPTLYEIVKSNMIHGPCGSLNKKSPCMNNESCSKNYPRPFLKDTQTGEDGYPKYRRRAPSDGGHTTNIRSIQLDNRWVVPYNPVLLRIFNAHINVEYCNSIKSIKYVCKYVNKGSDQAVFALENKLDEVSRYESGRYISSSEAAWRIFGFSIHERFPPVQHLSVHLENGQRVYFTSRNAKDKINNPPNTTLLAFFELCKYDDFAKTLLYCEVPSYYVWKCNKFERRKQGVPVTGYANVKKDHVLGRIYTVHPNNAECYYLRLLLNEVRGPTSFEDFKTVKGVVHPTFKSVCHALGLLEDDSHWNHTLEEATYSHSPRRIRELFAIIMVFCQVSDPLLLWEKHKENMFDDVRYHAEKNCFGRDVHEINKLIHNQCLLLLEDTIFTMGGQSLRHYGLPETSRGTDSSCNRDYARELSYNLFEIAKTIQESEKTLNEDQIRVYQTVLSSIASSNGDILFLDAPGGTGKTFIINLLLAKVRLEKQIAVAVASSGIAATLLEGGRTAHSAFKLPLNIHNIETPLCNISKQSNMAAVLRDCKLIVWDESTMSHKNAVEALDRTLRDLRNNNKLMGGVTVLLAGDFRQTLPVVPRGTRADEVKVCLKSSYLWPKVKFLTLRINMRVHLKGDIEAGEFSKLLLDIGNGDISEKDGKVAIPTKLCTVVSDLKQLTNSVYPNLKSIWEKDMSWFGERAILTPKNDMADEINLMLLNELTTPKQKYKSIDCVVELDDAVHYPVEFLNTLNPPGLSSHNLILKVGAPIILLRNIHPPKMCNGTRLQIKSLQKNLIEAVIFTGCGKGETVFIPRIPLISSELPFQFKRLQFPVKLCFAMTINKSQGQSLGRVGVDLRADCFSHGQLYVACSRVSSAHDLVILTADGCTSNIVYPEVLGK